ncbi:MAG: DUF87 domain-containing protein [Clostridia bacterium]|nr:DUF87 domain-containing protein [Clostridia bacterium]
MAKSSKKKNAAQYESNTLAAFAAVGIVLIALGVVSLLAVVGGLRGSFFSMVKQFMQGLAGGLCVGVSILLIWCGVLVAFSSGRHMPKRGIILVTVLYLAVLGIINLLSKIGTYSLFEYLTAYNNRLTPPAAEPSAFGNILTAAFAVCGSNGAFGGMLGMLLAWPAWTFLGTALGTVVLGLICAACVLLVSRFDLLQVVDTVRDGWHGHAQRKEQKRAQEAYQMQLEEQRRQAEEEERLRQSPAYMRRMQQPAQPQMMPQQNFVNYAQMPMQPQQPQGEIYDEIIIPEGRTLPWKKKGKKEPAQPQQPAYYQTRMTFTPSEMDVPEEKKPAQDGILVMNSRKKTQERIEAIRKRKAELTAEIEGNELAQAAAGAYAPEVQQPVAVEPIYQMPVQDDVYPVELDEPEEILEPIQPVQPVQPAPVADRTEAYKRPVSVPKPAPVQQPAHEPAPYPYPSIDLLNTQQRREAVDTRAADTEDAGRLEKTLESFGIPARVQRVTHGPAVTRFELGLTSSGINVKRIMGIADNIALDMAANGGVRIEIPIPGTNLFGVEVPNKEIQSVTLSEVLMSTEMRAAKSPLAVALGKDIAGRPVICDIAKMPHLLIAGQTGSGKSVCINTIINSILFRSSPEEVRMIMIDPKVVELQCYNVVPHLLIPVVSDPHKAAGALQWAVAEMLDRYHKMQSKNVRELSAYNAKLGPDEEKLPRIVIIIDELADLMLACKKEVEDSIIRIAQLARAAGIHMVVATQRPTVDVITGLIKANIPSRIAFAVASSIDSRTILDQNGAEKLLGRGDMFYFPTGASAPIRVQGCFMSDAETERVVNYIGQHSRVDFDPNVMEVMESDDDNGVTMADHDEESGVDSKLAEAIEMVITDGQASISMLQRRMKIGYARAGRLIDDMAARGIVSKSAGSKPREVLITREQYEQMKESLGI